MAKVAIAITIETKRRILTLLPHGGSSKITAVSIGNKIGSEAKCWIIFAPYYLPRC